MGLRLVAGDCSGYACRFVDRRRLDAEGVGKANEKAEQGCHVGRLGNLLVGPAHIAEALNLLVGDAIGGPADGFDEFQKLVLLWSYTGGIEVTVAKSFRYPFELFALQLQEPCV